MSIHLSSKLRMVDTPGSDIGHTLIHWCPGCKSRHLFNIEKPNSNNAIWKWDGNRELPSFTPSMNIVGRCHYHLTAGKLIFYADSIHSLAGQTVDLPDFPY